MGGPYTGFGPLYFAADEAGGAYESCGKPYESEGRGAPYESLSPIGASLLTGMLLESLVCASLLSSFDESSVLKGSGSVFRDSAVVLVADEDVTTADVLLHTRQKHVSSHTL